MASFTVTISNPIRCLGPGPTTKWGTPMTWGVSKWGEGTLDSPFLVRKLISNTQALIDTIRLSAHFNAFITNSIPSTFEGIDERLYDGSGYGYVFTGPASDGDERNQSVYTSGSAQGSSWTCGVVVPTVWGSS